LYRQVLPPTLGGRLIVTIVLLSLTTSLVTILVNWALIVPQGVPWREQAATSDVRGLLAFAAGETGELAAALESFPALSNSGPMTQVPEAAPPQTAGGFLNASGARALAITDASGRATLAVGDGTDAAALAKIASGRTTPVQGLLALDSGAYFVAGAPLVGGGYVLAARPFDKAKQERFEAIAPQVSMVLYRPGHAASSDRRVALQPVPGASDLGYVNSPNDVRVTADLRGIDGRTAAVAELVNTDTRTRNATDAALVSSLLSGLLAVGFGVSLGIVLTKVIRRPVERMVDHVKTRGYLAVEGAPYAAEASIDDPNLPVEFREFGAVVEDLLMHLSRRQADLKDAIAMAEYAEESLGIVVSESREAKIVLEDGRISIANPAAAVAVGRQQRDLFDLTLSEALEGTSMVDETGTTLEALALLEQAFETATTVQLSRDGQTPRWYVFQAARHADDLHNRILVTAQDVTEERRLQQIRSEIVSLISHDLRSPLAVVIGYLDLLRKPLAADERERAIDSAKRNAGRMADLLEDLLSATRAEELLAPAALLPVDLAGVAEEVVSSIAPTHSERPLAVDILAAPVVRGEEKRLRQVLVNLVTNAFKYSPEPRPVTVRVAREGQSALLQVVDHGPGVPEDDREKIFDRYTRLAGTSAGRPGVGLGLYIVRIIAENHGGCVRVTETPGGGATFTVELPLAGAVQEGRPRSVREAERLAAPAAGPRLEGESHEA
jgi:signal transduction histidine kinase